MIGRKHRELGIVQEVSYVEHQDGLSTLYLPVVLNKGGIQSFVSCALGPRIRPEYEKALCAVFGVTAVREIEGKKVYVLRCWNSRGAAIVGVESVDTGELFVEVPWLRQRGIAAPTPLDARRATLLQRLRNAAGQVASCSTELEHLQDDYLDWSVVSPGREADEPT